MINPSATTATILTLISLGLPGCSYFQPEASAEAPTQFHCSQEEGIFGTYASKNNVRSQDPLLVWQTLEFGDNYTPEERCAIVSERLSKTVAENSGRLAHLNLKTGQLNDIPVVCVIAKDELCDDDNLLFTLGEKNRHNPDAVLKTMLNFAHGKTYDNTVYENGEGSFYVPLEALVDPNLGQTVTW